MTLNTITNQAIALSGVSQAAHLVQQLATTGTADQQAIRASVGSILKIDSDSTEDISGGLSGIKVGLQQLHDQLTGHKIANPEQARYSASLVFLEKQLIKKPDMLATIQTGIKKAQSQAEHFDLLHENVLANLGDLYFRTVSTIQPRIMVNGEQHFLSNTDNVNKIRTLLLAGIRSAILWQQCGGSRWKFLFFRNKLQDEIQRLLAAV